MNKDNTNDNIYKNQIPVDEPINGQDVGINKTSETDKINNSKVVQVIPTETDKYITSILDQILISQQRMCKIQQKTSELLEEINKKQSVKDSKQEEIDSAEQKRIENINISKGNEAISKGVISTQKYRDYYDRHHTIVTGNANDPNDFESVVYTTNADQIDEIYVTLGRNAEKIFVSNDGVDTLFAIISHRGKTSFSKEEPIYPGEVKTFWNVYEMRFRSATAGVTYRVTEYNLCCNSSEQFTPIEKGVIHNQALPAAEADWFATEISPTNVTSTNPTSFRITVAVSIVGILRSTYTRSGNTQATNLNSGIALTAGALYTFDIPVHNGDTINLRYSTTTGTINIVRVEEIDSVVY